MSYLKLKSIYSKERIRKGNVLDIYFDKDLTRHRGKAWLINPKPSYTDNIPYLLLEVGKGNINQPIQVNFAHETWVVEFVSGQQKGFKTAVKVPYFHSTGVPKNIDSE